MLRQRAGGATSTLSILSRSTSCRFQASTAASKSNHWSAPVGDARQAETCPCRAGEASKNASTWLPWL
eukprot:951554-Prorocentrum_lima.AAC.1